MNKQITQMYCNGYSVFEIWDTLDGLLHYHKIEDVLWDAVLL